jgi:pimeloyl-ACP methyl ester carboxylesterase
MRDADYLSMMKSTIVRSGYRTQPLVRAAGALLSRLAPDATARFAADRFLAPPRASRPAHEVEVLRTARRRTIDVGCRRVPAWTWGQGPTVLLVHGWGGRGAQLSAFVEPLLARGCSVATFDAPAHGDAEGRRVTLPEMVATLRAAAATAEGPIHGIVAHSVGALVAARALYEGLAARRLVFLAPAADLQLPTLAFGDALGLSRRVRERMRREIEGRVGVPWDAFDIVRLAWSQTAPLLVVHDRGDGEVPWQQGLAIARAWPDASLLTTDALGHRRILRDPAVVAAATDFIAAPAASPWTRTSAGDWQPGDIGERVAAGIVG